MVDPQLTLICALLFSLDNKSADHVLCAQIVINTESAIVIAACYSPYNAIPKNNYTT